MNTAFKDAKWITQSYLLDERPQEGKVTAFRRDYVLPRTPFSCILNIAAFKNCALWVNGKRVYNSQLRFWAKHVRYDTLDIAPYLKKGRNSLAVVLTAATGSLGYSEYVRPAWMLYAEAECGEEKVCMRTDHTWHGCAAVWYGFGEYMISVPTAYQEHYNERAKEPTGWKTNLKYQSWPGVFELGGVGTPPFVKMSPRDIPYLEEKEAACECVWTGCGEKTKRKLSYEPAKHFNKETKQGSSTRLAGDAAYDNAEENIFTFDFGKTAFIRPGIEVLERKGTVRAEFYYSLEHGEEPNACTAFGFACEGFTDSFTPSAGTEGWEALWPRGFRFMTVKIVGSGYLKFRVCAKRVEYPYGAAYKAEGEDELMCRIWDTAAETLRSGTNDVIVDTCSRENVLWTLDAMVAAKAAWYTFGDSQMWRRCLLLVGEGVDEKGNFKTVVPSADSFMKLIDQNLYWVRSCYEYYALTKDRGLLEETAPAIYSLLALCSRHITEEKLFSPPDYTWHWVDWANIDKRPYSLPINCILIHAAKAGEQIAKVLADQKLAQLSAEIIETILPECTRFYEPSLNCFVSHIEPQGDIPAHNHFGFLPPDKVTPLSIHAVMLAVSCGCGTEEMRRKSMETIAALVRVADEPQTLMGPGWTEILLSVLFDYGYAEEAVQYVKLYYGRYIKLNAPTYGEGFGSGAVFNTAHSWGSSVNSLIAQHQEAFGVKIINN